MVSESVPHRKNLADAVDNDYNQIELDVAMRVIYGISSDTYDISPPP
ncbi:MAG: hypothetical protein WBZ36_06610 [Candidatus Nitrosopolaris sp.]